MAEAIKSPSMLGFVTGSMHSPRFFEFLFFNFNYNTVCRDFSDLGIQAIIGSILTLKSLQVSHFELEFSTNIGTTIYERYDIIDFSFERYCKQMLVQLFYFFRKKSK